MLSHSGKSVKAERIVAEELRRLGWKEGQLAARRKGDPDKFAIALRVRRETTLMAARIAQRLHCGKLEEPAKQALPPQQGPSIR
jgi:hypothetical protein